MKRAPIIVSCCSVSCCSRYVFWAVGVACIAPSYGGNIVSNGGLETGNFTGPRSADDTDQFDESRGKLIPTVEFQCGRDHEQHDAGVRLPRRCWVPASRRVNGQAAPEPATVGSVGMGIAGLLFSRAAAGLSTIRFPVRGPAYGGEAAVPKLRSYAEAGLQNTVVLDPGLCYCRCTRASSASGRRHHMKSFVGWKTASLLAVAVACMAPSYAGNIVSNGGFETGDFTGWTQTGNSTFNGVECPGSGVPQGNCDAFFGPVGSLGGISQVLTTQAGLVYAISFYFQPEGGSPTSFSASFGGTTLTSLTNPASSPYQLLSFGAVASSASTTLSFNFRDDPGFMLLDAVNVQVAPEPATIGLVGIGIGGLLFWRRRRA